MSWLTKILKGSSGDGRCQCHKKHDGETTWDQAPNSVILEHQAPNSGPSSDFDKEEIDQAIALSIAKEDKKGKGVIKDEFHLDKDEQIAKTPEEGDDELPKAIQESLNVHSPPQSPRNDYGGSLLPYPFVCPSGYRIRAGCNSEIGHERYVSCRVAVWHPECLRCHSCNRPISENEFSMSDNRPYHKSCYKELHHPKCEVCKNFIPTNDAGLIEYRAHPFWAQKYCPSHDHDGTPRCCSCERMEPVETRYLILEDGRKLCLECLDSSIMDRHECQQLYLEIQEFYERLNMKLEQQIPLVLVEREALNEAMEGEKEGHHHMPEPLRLCLSEVQIVSTILRRPRIKGYRIIEMSQEPYRLVWKCEAITILVLHGLPRLLNGSIMAHQMMHAWLRLKGCRTLSPNVEEGICQVLAHMWLDSEIFGGSATTNVASTSPSSSSSSSSNSMMPSSKKGKLSELEKKLGKCFIHQIESDSSATYGDGFREGNQAIINYGLKKTLDHILLKGCFPCEEKRR